MNLSDCRVGRPEEKTSPFAQSAQSGAPAEVWKSKRDPSTPICNGRRSSLRMTIVGIAPKTILRNLRKKLEEFDG